MNRKQLEYAAIRAHADGATWGQFWPTIAADVAALEPDYYERGRLIHRLVGLVASGDVDGQQAAGDGWPPEADSEPQTVPVIGDTTTAARLLWQPTKAGSPAQ